MFFKKMTESQKAFYNNYKNFPQELKDIVMVWINLYGFLKIVIKDNIFPKLEKYILLNEEMRNYIYYFITYFLKTHDLIKQFPMMGKSENDKILTMSLMTGLVFSNTRNTNNLTIIKELELDGDYNIAYVQVMTKLFALVKMEYKDSDEYNEIYNEIIMTCKNYLGGALMGFNEMDTKTKENRMFEIIDNANEGVVANFNLSIKAFVTNV